MFNPKKIRTDHISIHAALIARTHDLNRIISVYEEFSDEGKGS